jgi:hypothetical protein
LHEVAFKQKRRTSAPRARLDQMGMGRGRFTLPTICTPFEVGLGPRERLTIEARWSAQRRQRPITALVSGSMMMSRRSPRNSAVVASLRRKAWTRLARGALRLLAKRVIIGLAEQRLRGFGLAGVGPCDGAAEDQSQSGESKRDERPASVERPDREALRGLPLDEGL